MDRLKNCPKGARNMPPWQAETRTRDSRNLGTILPVCTVVLAWDHLDGLADDEECAHAHEDDAQAVLLLLAPAMRVAAATADARRRG